MYRLYRERKWVFFFVLALYFVLWLFPRWPSISENTLHMDDFLIAEQNHLVSIHPEGALQSFRNVSCSLPPQDGRWILISFLCPLQAVMPDWTLRVWPKIIAGLAVSVASTCMAFVFVGLGTPNATAFTLPVLLLSSPILSEISVWNTAIFISVALTLVVAAVLVAQRDQKWPLVMLCLLLAVFIYEIYLTIFLVATVALYMVRLCEGGYKPSSADFRRIGSFAVVSFVYVTVLIISQMLQAPGRGLVRVVALDAWIADKVKGVLDLMVNAYLPSMGLYNDTPNVYSWWKLGPAVVAGLGIAAGLLAKLSVIQICLLTSLLIVLPILPTLPLFAASQSPESWRVSVPILIAFLFSIAGACAVVANKARTRQLFGAFSFALVATAAIVTASAVQLLATAEESRLRVLENRWDQSTVDDFISFWRDRGGESARPITVIRVNVGSLERLGLSRAQNLTVAYGRRGVNSAFGFDFAWQPYLNLSVRGSGVVIIPHDDALRCAGNDGDPCLDASQLEGLAKRCRSESLAGMQGFRWIHLEERRLSAVCI